MSDLFDSARPMCPPGDDDQPDWERRYERMRDLCVRQQRQVCRLYAEVAEMRQLAARLLEVAERAKRADVERRE